MFDPWFLIGLLSADVATCDDEGRRARERVICAAISLDSWRESDIARLTRSVRVKMRFPGDCKSTGRDLKNQAFRKVLQYAALH